MEIKTISRTISGNSYDNFSATAELDEGENIIEAFKKLDTALRQSLNEINLNQQIIDNGNMPF